MSKLLVAGDTLKCSMGTAPSALCVLPERRVVGVKQCVATIQDYRPGVNIMPFTLCTSPSNPQVAAAKSPQPCVPVVTSPWASGSPSVRLADQTVLTDDSKCRCQWGGVIELANPGQQSLQTPGGG